MSLLGLRIRGRLYAGFGTLMLLGVGGAGFAVLQVLEIGSEIDTMTVQSANTVRAGEISLHAIRGAILRYAFDQDEPSIVAEQRRSLYVGVQNNLSELRSKRAALGDTIRQMAGGRSVLLAEGLTFSGSAPILVNTTRILGAC